VTGALKAKVGGAWVPVGQPGPNGADGPPGPPASTPKVKGRAYTASLTRGTNSNGTMQSIVIGSVILVDGFSGVSGAPGATLNSAAGAPAGRFYVAMHVTIGSGAAQNWMILRLQHLNSANTVLNNYDTVAANVSTGFRTGSVSCVIDMAPGDKVWTFMQTDVAGAAFDGRSWLTLAEIAW